MNMVKTGVRTPLTSIWVKCHAWYEDEGDWIRATIQLESVQIYGFFRFDDNFPLRLGWEQDTTVRIDVSENGTLELMELKINKFVVPLTDRN